ncbi:MAG: energy transducer TonB [Pyrinomonadaceae bacterium]
MFDKLVASEPEGADFKNRRRYFVTSSFIVGVLFLAAVVASIFAADFGLGSNSFELVEMLAPVEMASVEPETPQPQRQNNQSQTTNDLPKRTSNIPRIEESPTAVPTTTSTTRNTEVTRPIGAFIQNARFNSDPVGGAPSGREPSQGGGKSGSGGLAQSTPVEPTEDTQAPRDIKKPKPPTVSKGVLNGDAKYLPKPAYSPAAKAVQAKGKVTVQVTIDERGNVVSANAVDGHPMLRGDAERAARNAKFSPTLLSEVPVKVTGVITYNFIL